MGFVLWQKKFSCSRIHPACCQGGWQVVMVGSPFCTPAETRYAPIKGDLLGVTWALTKTSHYTLGCDKLLVLVDHKPLLGLLTKRGLGEIENPRLEALEERTMCWYISIEHMAGARNFGSNALSHYPGGCPPLSCVNSVQRCRLGWTMWKPRCWQM